MTRGNVHVTIHLHQPPPLRLKYPTSANRNSLGRSTSLLYSSSLSNSIAFTLLARLFGTAGPLVFGCCALFSAWNRYLNKPYHVRLDQNTGIIEVHVLAGGLETGLVSGLGGTCGRLDGACSEILCLTFRDLISRCVSETSAAGVCTGSTAYSEDSPLSRLPLLKAEPLAGSERNQLR